MAADTLDVLTSAEAYAAINVDATGSPHQGELERAVTGISRILDRLCGPVVEREVTELHDGGSTSIRPRDTPVASVTTLTEYEDTTATVLTQETNATKPADAYLLDRSRATSHDVALIRRSNGADTRFQTGRRNVELVAQAGRYADTASVDALFKTAAASVLRRLWDREAGAWTRAVDPFEVDNPGPSSRFFNAVKHVVDEQLAAEKLPPGIA